MQIARPTVPDFSRGLPDTDLRSNVAGKQILFPDRVFHEEHILDLNPAQRVALHLKTAFVDTPTSIWKGVTGDPEYNFGDFLRTGKVPYYLGGVFLTMLFVAGGSKVTALRQGIGVLSYYLGVMAGNSAIDAAVKAKYGVDLNMKFKKYTGEVENVFTSPVFSRYDLVSEHDYEQMRKKMGIPSYIADPKGEVQGVIQNLIPAVRTGKIIFSTMIAAFGAGYLARSDAWAKLLEGFKPLKTALFDPKSGPVHRRIANGFTMVKHYFKDVVQEKFLGRGQFAKNPAWVRYGAMGLVALAGIYAFSQILRVKPSKEFERPGFGINQNKQPLRASALFHQFMMARHGNTYPQSPSDIGGYV